MHAPFLERTIGAAALTGSGSGAGGSSGSAKGTAAANT
jgi:hypothetical protein